MILTLFLKTPGSGTALGAVRSGNVRVRAPISTKSSSPCAALPD
jgi:hypothetical protein